MHGFGPLGVNITESSRFIFLTLVLIFQTKPFLWFNSTEPFLVLISSIPGYKWKRICAFFGIEPILPIFKISSLPLISFFLLERYICLLWWTPKIVSYPEWVTSNKLPSLVFPNWIFDILVILLPLRSISVSYTHLTLPTNSRV